MFPRVHGCVNLARTRLATYPRTTAFRAATLALLKAGTTQISAPLPTRANRPPHSTATMLRLSSSVSSSASLFASFARVSCAVRFFSERPPYDRGAERRPFTCYNCGKEGHSSRDCASSRGCGGAVVAARTRGARPFFTPPPPAPLSLTRPRAAQGAPGADVLPLRRAARHPRLPVAAQGE